jgi:ribosomal protein L16/L10AE
VIKILKKKMSKFNITGSNLRYKKVFRAGKSLFRNTLSNNKIFSFGFCGLRLIDSGSLTYRELEAIRRVISRYSKRRCKV